MKRFGQWPRLLLIALVAGLVATASHGADEAAPPPQSEGDAPAAEIQMDDVEIRGELERPDVFYIIPRRKADMDLGSLTKDYEREIMVPLLPAPFEATHRDLGGRGD